MATLTPEIAKDLMWRSMTTGAPTSEFDKYGGYDKVNALYASNGGGYGFDEMTPEFLDAVDDVIANSGVGNLAVLEKTGTPLSAAAYQRLASSGIGIDGQFLQNRGIPYEGFLQAPKKTPTATQPAATTNLSQPETVGRVMGPLPGASASSGANTSAGAGSGNGFNTWRAGAAGNEMLGAGNADYHSELLKSLRQSSITPFSNNAGVQFMQHGGGNSTNSTPAGTQALAFNPQVLSPRTASPQEVADWNAYSAYRTNALNSKTPMLSMAEWLAGGKTDGKPVTPEITPEVANWSGY